MSAQIKANSQVTMHFAIRLNDGTEVDSNFDAKPGSFRMGDGSVLEGFEQTLLGLVVGDHKKIQVPPESGFGMPNPANVQEFGRDQFAPDTELVPGLVISFSDAANTELPGVISKVEEDLVLVDFNHPLAGETLEFEVKILDVVNDDE